MAALNTQILSDVVQVDVVDLKSLITPVRTACHKFDGINQARDKAAYCSFQTSHNMVRRECFGTMQL